MNNFSKTFIKQYLMKNDPDLEQNKTIFNLC